jgi:uncharacterized membrane protein YphA (DoxX/SURF4 family)
MFRSLISTKEDNRSLIPRIIVGLVFLSEGIQKLIFPEITGAARFDKIGFENPEFLASFVAVFEIVCGVFVLTGTIVRLTVIPLLIIMITAIVTTKIPILTEESFWRMAHAARTDFAMLLLSVYLLIYGGGKWSVDRFLQRL